MNSKKMETYLSELFYACDDVKTLGMCSECPFRPCLEEISLLEFACETPKSYIDEFMEFAKSCEPSEEDYIALRADEERKRDQEESVIERT